MSEIFVPLAFWIAILFPIGVFVWQIRRMRRGTLSPGRAAIRFFLISVMPIGLYVLVFFLAAAIEEMCGVPMVAEGYARSLLLVLAIGVVWVVLMTMVFAIVAMSMSRKRV